ncbi:hypothetical protein HUR95_15795 [Caldalkalibacillus thermarum TA2.A1]|uniref:Uncharacterized protein n=1 Tax=Caldalkalibacillus thermarum (strain TA2.A1) TaxID=986075 RepID=A0A8X8L721_CALTT|nr:DUF6573 family protein [Caldalkalibacillus thermarum]QZT33667.1 hypothetical protein HUR95_15795 [Caldalkalibacillus thermarum TA2.A1]
MEVIYSYSRKEAIEDGVLVDVTETAKEMGFRFPVAVTRTVWDAILTPSPFDSVQSTSGRLWDCLWMLFLAIKRGNGGGSEIFFSFIVNNEGEEKLVDLKAVCHPGDMMEPVITIMFPDED